jgi:3-phenylpropionate/cinnamic acid dioxygenase small subunit
MAPPDLADRIALEDLLIRYAVACDAKDWDAYRALFTDDATIDYTAAYGIAGPRDEVTAWMARVVGDVAAVPITQHMITNFRVAVDGDAARGEADYFNADVLQDPAGERGLVFHGGRYGFEARRTATGWLLARLSATLFWSHRGELYVFPGVPLR